MPLAAANQGRHVNAEHRQEVLHAISRAMESVNKDNAVGAGARQAALLLPELMDKIPVLVYGQKYSPAAYSEVSSLKAQIRSSGNCQRQGFKGRGPTLYRM